MDLVKLRERIDSIDEKMAELIKERFDAVCEIGEIKKRENMPVKNAGREAAVLENVSRNMPNDKYKEAVKNVYITIMAESRNLES